MKKYLVYIILITIGNLSYSQSEVLISKQDVLENVKANNATLKMSQQDVLMAKGEFNQTNAILLPEILVSHTGIATTNPLMAFGSKLNQEILTASDFNPSLLNSPSQIEDYATKVEVKQPLINVDGIFQRKAAKAKLEAVTLQSERTQDYVNLEVEKAYIQLQLAYKTVDVLETALEAAKENLKLANNSFEQGYLQRSDVLAVEVRVTDVENQLFYAKSNVKNVSNYLSVLMNDKTFDVYKPLDSLIVNSLVKTINSLPENRADLQAMQLSTKAYKNIYKADKTSFLPRINAFGTYEMHDDQIFQGDANGYLFGAQLSWSIFEGSKRFGKTQKSKAEYEKSKLNLEQYKAQSQLELNRVRRMLQDAENNLELSKLALEQSQEALRIRTNRFKEGLEKTSDLLITETQFQQKQLEYYATIYQHNYALAYFQYLTKE
ncbi:MAG: TolC family protein [Bacteroidia bacterium]|nr:TolC family protein [Bacteroidia bacterium]